jgi:hypothetical protein
MAQPTRSSPSKRNVMSAGAAASADRRGQRRGSRSSGSSTRAKARSENLGADAL